MTRQEKDLEKQLASGPQQKRMKQFDKSLPLPRLPFPPSYPAFSISSASSPSVLVGPRRNFLPPPHPCLLHIYSLSPLPSLESIFFPSP